MKERPYLLPRYFRTMPRPSQGSFAPWITRRG